MQTESSSSVHVRIDFSCKSCGIRNCFSLRSLPRFSRVFPLFPASYRLGIPWLFQREYQLSLLPTHWPVGSRYTYILAIIREYASRV